MSHTTLYSLDTPHYLRASALTTSNTNTFSSVRATFSTVSNNGGEDDSNKALNLDHAELSDQAVMSDISSDIDDVFTESATNAANSQLRSDMDDEDIWQNVKYAPGLSDVETIKNPHWRKHAKGVMEQAESKISNKTRTLENTIMQSLDTEVKQDAFVVPSGTEFEETEMDSDDELYAFDEDNRGLLQLEAEMSRSLGRRQKEQADEDTDPTLGHMSVMELLNIGQRDDMEQAHEYRREFWGRVGALEPEFVESEEDEDKTPELVRKLVELEDETAVVQKQMPKPKVRNVDEQGRAFGKGTRKTANAHVWLTEGEGWMYVNKMPHTEYFEQWPQRQHLVAPFLVTNTELQYDVHAFVSGGGKSAQAQALRLAISRALEAANPALRSVLKPAGLLTVDPRVVERKKFGLVKARKAPTWVKR
jgi:small subunit ribosomal protein S9